MENFDQYKYKKAKEKVHCIRSLYANLLAFCLVIPFLAYLNYRTTSYPWVIFPAIGWGLGLIAHWLNVYGYAQFLGKDWEERKIKQFMDDNES